MTLQELQEKLAGRAVLEAELEGLFSQKSALEEWLQREKVNLEYERSDVQDALREMLEENRHGTVFGEYERRKEAEKRRDQVLIQTQRFLDLIVKSGIKFANEYCIDPANIDNMIRRTVIRCYNSTPNADLFVPDIPDMTVNVAGILDELEKKTERSKRHQAAMELKLSQLLEKYQTT